MCLIYLFKKNYIPTNITASPFSRVANSRKWHLSCRLFKPHITFAESVCACRLILVVQRMCVISGGLCCSFVLWFGRWSRVIGGESSRTTFGHRNHPQPVEASSTSRRITVIPRTTTTTHRLHRDGHKPPNCIRFAQSVSGSGLRVSGPPKARRLGGCGMRGDEWISCGIMSSATTTMLYTTN